MPENNATGVGDLLEAVFFTSRHEAIVDTESLYVWRTWCEPYTSDEIKRLVADLQAILTEGDKRGAGWLDRHLATITCYLRNYGPKDAPPAFCDCNICSPLAEHYWLEQERIETEKRWVAEQNRLRQIPRVVRNRVFERDGYRCVKCGSQHRPTIDHITPYSKGGTHDESNLQTLCLSCNCRKGAQ